MSVLIPRAEIDAVMERYGDDWPGSYDVPAGTVRQVAKECRSYADGTKPSRGSLTPEQFRAEADELDALVDRIENERDDHCIAYNQDPDTGECVCGHPYDVHAGTLGQCEAPLNAEVTA